MFSDTNVRQGTIYAATQGAIWVFIALYAHLKESGPFVSDTGAGTGPFVSDAGAGAGGTRPI